MLGQTWDLFWWAVVPVPTAKAALQPPRKPPHYWHKGLRRKKPFQSLAPIYSPTVQLSGVWVQEGDWPSWWLSGVWVLWQELHWTLHSLGHTCEHLTESTQINSFLSTLLFLKPYTWKKMKYAFWWLFKFLFSFPSYSFVFSFSFAACQCSNHFV